MKYRFLIIISLLIYFFIPELYGYPDKLKINTGTDIINIQPGESGIIKINIEIPEKSYIYGNPKGPGTGKPTTVDIIVKTADPAGMKLQGDIMFGSVKFMPPKKHTAEGDTDFVWIYEKNTTIDIPYSVKKNAIPGAKQISIMLSALLCTDRSCTPQDFTIDYTINIAGSNIKISDSGNRALAPLSRPSRGDDEGISADSMSIPESLIAPGALSFKPGYISDTGISNILQAIIYGILAGLILNFMPCVLPVISLKLADIVRYSGSDRKETAKLGILFSLGIMTSFALLAFLFSFMGYGWGGLFEKQGFLLIMICVVFIMALSMFDVFSLNTPGFTGRLKASGKNPDTYLKGLLATLLATPCSGPFLGGTLAWTYAKPPAVIFLVFMSIGIGMSLPYIILAINPALTRFIPKPGDWMITLERIMAFLLVGTCVYLISIIKDDLLIPTLWFLLFIAIAFWQFGKYGSLLRSGKSRLLSAAALILIILAGYFLSYKYFINNEEIITANKSGSKTFSMPALLENKENGRISIVEFTADWCPNCKLVEKASLYTDKAADAIKKHNAVLLIADMTRDNPEAKALLTGLGSRSIPFLAVFPAGDRFTSPVCLRDIYSAGDVVKAIGMAGK